MPAPLIIVSHDRAFLDNVVTSVLVCKGDGRIEEHVGGYSDWLAYESLQVTPDTMPKDEAAIERGEKKDLGKTGSAPRKLGYREQQEYDSLPEKIDALETEQKELEQAANDPQFYEQDHNAVAQALQKLEAINQELDDCYQRWATLDAVQSAHNKKEE